MRFPLPTWLALLVVAWLPCVLAAEPAEPEVAGRQPVWEIELPSEPVAPVSVVRGGEDLLVAMEGRLELRSVSDGAVRWSRKLPPGAFVSVAGSAGGATARAVAWTWSQGDEGAMELAGLASGATRWRATLPEPPVGPALPPASDGDPWLVPLMRRVAIVDGEGRVRPGRKVPDPIAPPLLRVAGHPAAVLNSGRLAPLTLRPSRRVPGQMAPETTAVRGGEVFSVSSRRLHAWRCRVTGSGRLRCYEDWSQPLGAAVTAPPVIAGDKVVVGSWDTFLYAFDVDTGHLRWRRRVERRLQTRLLLADRLLVVGLRDPARVDVFSLKDGAEVFGVRLPDGEVMSFGPSEAGGRLITVSVSALDDRPLLRAWPWTAAADQSPPRNAESSRDSMSR
jgi:hypothetical protein